jgi:predicted permease
MTWFVRLFRRRRLYDDLSEEIRGHIDERADELVADGMSVADARDAARRAFGNATHVAEQGRETWEWPTVESFLSDVRYSIRQLRRAPGLVVTIVLTLALGIAATTTVFSWARSVLLNPLPGAGDAGRVWALETTTASGSWTPTSWLDYRDFRKYLRSFDGLAAAYPTSVAVGDAAHAERRQAEMVSANFFDVLHVRPALGRFFPATLDETPGAEPTVVIGYSMWQSRWHGDTSVIGSVIRINRFPFTIIGVAPEAFHGSMPGEQVEAWVPAAMLGQIVPTGSWWLTDRGTRTFRVLARVSAGVSPGAARSEVESFTMLMAKANGDVSKGMGGRLLPLWQSHWGVQDALRAPLAVLLAACGLVLLIVCANAANLLLARATSRRREFSVRLALGAPRHRLLRQLLTEASILAAAGSGLGLLSAVWLARSLVWLLPSFAAPALLGPRVDGQVVAFTVILAGVVTLLAGIAPAIHGSREALGGALNDGGRGAVSGLYATRTRSLLVMAEAALAVTALVGAGLFYDSFRHTRAVSPGFDASHVAIAAVSVTLAGYDSARGDAFLRDVADQIASQPGVSAVSYADYVPLSIGSGSWEDLRIEGYAAEPSENMKLYRAAIGPNYFKVLHIPLLAGRDFTMDDDSAHAAVMIVNEAFVRRYLNGRAVLGVKVRGWGRWFTIVGVANDIKVYRLTDPPTPYFYVPVRQVYRPEYGYAFFERTDGSMDRAVASIATATHSVDPTVPVFNAMPLADYIEAPLREQQTALTLLGALAIVASVLAAIGLYGVMAYAVAQRTKEIGVRIALGARRSHIVRVVALRSAALVSIGLMVGLAGGAAVARMVSSMLFSVSAGDLPVFAFAGLVMIVVAAAATVIPAWRATTVDPLTALRAD